MVVRERIREKQNAGKLLVEVPGYSFRHRIRIFSTQTKWPFSTLSIF